MFPHAIISCLYPEGHPHFVALSKARERSVDAPQLRENDIIKH